MTLIFDNLISTVVAMTVVLILASVQLRATKQNIAGTSHYVTKQHTKQLSSWLQEDLGKIGKNMGDESVPVDTMVVANDDSTAKWLTKELVFERDSIGTGGNRVRVKVRYDVQKTGTRTIGGEERDVFQLARERKVGSDPWESAGGGAATLEYFDVDMLNKDAGLVEDPVEKLQSNPDTVRSVRIRFSVVPPFQNDQLPVSASRTNTVVAQYLPADPWD
ncbi:MAG: hypothetical protein BRD48_06225 [Bacteroidetes bacterium QS_9_68_14]|nr:MAG: hypothetical protein BRD48_06225 [Bacteroidetes bacterium QS_9_68_14]